MSRSCKARGVVRALAFILPGLLLTFCVRLPVFAQGFTSARVVTARPVLSLDKVPAGSPFRVAVVLEIAAGWHVNAHMPTFDYLIPTTAKLAASPAEGVVLREPAYPAPEEKPFAFTSGKLLRVYEGRVVILLEGSVAADAAAGPRRLQGTLTAQACSDDSCLAPAKLPLDMELPVVPLGEASRPANQEIFGLVEAPGGQPPAQAGPSPEAAAPPSNQVSDWVARRGWGLTLFFIFLGGLALNGTPCVFPMIPITLSYFGGQAAGRPSRTFGLASLYVLGMCLTYSALGVVAAMTGGIFGKILQSKASLLFLALVMFALGLSMLGLFEIQVPLALRRRISSRPGAGGALFMGLTVGLVAAPCVGPFVVSLLAFVAQSRNPMLGFLLFFVLALGLGLPFLLLGGFAGAATGLPKAGAWMVWVRKIFAFILFAMACYFLNPLLPDAIAGFTIPAVLVAAAAYLGFMEGSPIRTRGFRIARLSTAFGFAAVAAALLIPSSATAGVPWTPYSEEGLARALAAGRPVLIDFTADWCLPCKELDRFTFADPRVVAETGRFVALKVDITTDTTEESRRLQEKYEILGAPTIVFIDSTGRERRDLRLTGFEGAGRFLERLNGIR